MAPRKPQGRTEFVGVTITGIDEMRKDMGRLGKEYRRSLDKELRGVAQPITRDAKARYKRRHGRATSRALGRRRRRGRSKGSVRGVRATIRRGRPAIVLNGDRYPWLPGQEWGSNRYPQFPRKTQHLAPHKRGYFYWPAIMKGSLAATRAVYKAIDRANATIFANRRGRAA